MMTTGRSLTAFLALVLASLVSPEAEAKPPKQVDVHMFMSIAGLTVGSIKLSTDVEKDTVTSGMKLRSQGLMKWITGYKGQSEAKSTLPSTNWPMPISYLSTYETKRFDRKIVINYSPDAGDITDFRTWKRGKPQESKIPEQMRLETIDPLTAMIQLRRWIEMVRAEPSTPSTRTFEIFDGGRRYRLDAEIQERIEVKLRRRPVPAFRLKVKMTPMAGFNSKDLLANWSSEDGKRWIEVIISDDDNPIPFSLKTIGGSLETKIWLHKICTDGDKCITQRG